MPVFPEQTRLSAYYEADHLWAQPDAGHLARLMRGLVDGSIDGGALGEKAREDVLTEWNAERMTDRLYRLVDDLHERTRETTESHVSTPARAATINVAWTGPLYEDCGYADEGRGLTRALADTGTPLRTFPMTWSPRRAEFGAEELARLTALEQAPLVSGRPCVMVQHTLGGAFTEPREDVPCAGRTMFETDRIPAGWVESCNRLDRIWVPSEFNRRTFAAAGVEPAFRPKEPPAWPTARPGRIGCGRQRRKRSSGGLRSSAASAGLASRSPWRSASRRQPSAGRSGAWGSTNCARSSRPSRCGATSATTPASSSTSTSRSSAASTRVGHRITGDPQRGRAGAGRAARGSAGSFVHVCHRRRHQCSPIARGPARR